MSMLTYKLAVDGMCDAPISRLIVSVSTAMKRALSSDLPIIHSFQGSVVQCVPNVPLISLLSPHTRRGCHRQRLTHATGKKDFTRSCRGFWGFVDAFHSVLTLWGAEKKAEANNVSGCNQKQWWAFTFRANKRLCVHSRKKAPQSVCIWTTSSSLHGRKENHWKAFIMLNDCIIFHFTVLPLVTFVKWNAGACSAPSGETGSCLHANECQLRGGIAGGQCAGGKFPSLSHPITISWQLNPLEMNF